MRGAAVAEKNKPGIETPNNDGNPRLRNDLSAQNFEVFCGESLLCVCNSYLSQTAKNLHQQAI